MILWWVSFLARLGETMDPTGTLYQVPIDRRPPMISITVRHHFSAGHRIPGLPGPGAKCANIHGHTFGVSWEFAAPDLDASTVEFTSIKKVVRGWVDEVLDHGFLVGRGDREVIEYLSAAGSKHYVLDTPPTTEAIAALIADNTRRLLPDLDLLAVEVTEGPHNAARWAA